MMADLPGLRTSRPPAFQKQKSAGDSPCSNRRSCPYAAMSQRDVADLLKVGSGAAVCNQLTPLTGKLAKDRRLRHLLKQAEKRLETARAALRVNRG